MIEDLLKKLYNIDIREGKDEKGIITNVVLGPTNLASYAELRFVLCQNELSHCNVDSADWIAMR